MASSAPAAAQQPSSVDPTASLSADPRLMLAISEFQAVWQAQWRLSEEYRRRQVDPSVTRARWNYSQCYREVIEKTSARMTEDHGRYYGFPEPQYPRLSSSVTAFGVCPTWLLTPSVPQAEDETTWRDGAILPANRPTVQRARSRLLETLTQAYSKEPANGWIAGQLVRFRLDARDLPGALEIAQHCTTPTWWCAGLTGFVQARMDAVPDAEAAFDRMRNLMPDSVRCDWTNVRDLLPPAFQLDYAALSCSAQESAHIRLWWLADPLYRVWGNERLVEQEVRRMEVALRRATLQDERYAFDATRGGDAVSRMIQRYGWPTYTAWRGAKDDEYRGDALMRIHSSPPAPPSTTFEYTVGRMQAVPSRHAITSPFEATSEDWTIAGEDSLGRPTTTWWPIEHFRPARRLVQFPHGQTVFVRRQTHAEIGTALSLVHPAMRDARAAFDVLLLTTNGPAQIDSLDQQVAAGGKSVVLRGVATRSPTLVAIEALGQGTAAVDARTRFAVTPPPPLAAMKPREVALSSIAVLAPVSGAQLQQPSDSLLRYLLPSLQLARDTRKVTLYWETYGVLPEDSARVSLAVASEIDLGLLRRLGIAARLASDPNSYLAIAWNESEVRGNTTTLLGPVPLQMRTLALDLGSLKPGRYTIELTVTLQDGRTTSSSVPIELLP